MNYTSKNIEYSPYTIKCRSAGLHARNIFISIISLFLLSFFTVGVQAQHINNHKQEVLVNKNSVASKTAFTFTSSSNGLWSNSSTWGGGGIPNFGDDVIISPGTTVTVDINTATCLNITINGTLTFNAGINLDVNGNWSNTGTFNAGSGSVTFKGASYNTINGNSSFNNIIVNKGTNVTSVIEASAGILSNTGNITITNGLFKMTTGTFQLNSNPNIPATGGIWINGATLNGGNFTTTNDGWIRISSGIANFGTSSGNSVHTQNRGYFDVSGGVVNISGRLENTASTPLLTGIPGNGASITGGTITVSTVGNGLSNTGSFDMSTSSVLNMSGGSVIFQIASTAVNPLDINMLSGTGIKTISGGTFQLGNVLSPAGSTFLINSAISINNVNVYNNTVKASLAGDLTINNQLTLNGQLLLNNQNLILSSTALAVAGTLGAANGMIVCNNGAFGGEVRKILSSNSSYLFPVGSSSAEYSPATLTFTGTAGVKVANTKHPNNANTTNYIKRYWTINSSGITSGVYDITANYLAADIVGTDASIIMGKYTALPWVKYNAANTGSKTLTATGVNNLGLSIGFTGITLAPPTITITPASPAICNGSSVTLIANASGDPTIMYLWSPGGATTSSITVSPASSTAYTVTVTDGNGFTASDNTTVTVNPKPSPIIYHN